MRWRTRRNHMQIDSSILETLARTALKWAPEQGVQATALDGVELVRWDDPTHFTPAVYDPSLIFIVQGRKIVRLGDSEIEYGPLDHLVSAVHLPVSGQVVEASPARPYLGIKMSIDTQDVADLVLQLGDQAPETETRPDALCALSTAGMSADMLGALSRLVGLLDKPADAPILAPLA